MCVCVCVYVCMVTPIPLFSDYGYSRKSLKNCSRSGEFSLAEVCPPGTTTYQQSTG